VRLSRLDGLEVRLETFANGVGIGWRDDSGVVEFVSESHDDVDEGLSGVDVEALDVLVDQELQGLAEGVVTFSLDRALGGVGSRDGSIHTLEDKGEEHGCDDDSREMFLVVTD